MVKHHTVRAIAWKAQAALPLKSNAEYREIAFQQIADLGTGRVTAYEAIRRLSNEWRGPSNECFGDPEGEVAAIARSIEAVRGLPHGVALLVKASPSAIAWGALAGAIAGMPHEQIVVELTDDLAPVDTDALFYQARLLQFRGVKIAMNGPGPGQSGLRQTLRIRPELIKIDRHLISGIAADCGRRSLIAEHVSLAREIGAQSVGERIDTRRELATLRSMGVDLGQGSMIGRPVDFETALCELSFMRHAEIW